MSTLTHRVMSTLCAAVLAVGGGVVVSPAAHADTAAISVFPDGVDAAGCSAEFSACRTVAYALSDSTVDTPTIRIGGIYVDPVDIGRAATLTGDPTAPATLSNIVDITAAGVTVEGLTFTGAGGIVASASATITDNHFDGVTGTAAIALTGSANATVPVSVSVGGNTGTVAPGTSTITTSGDVTVSTPSMNTIRPTPAPTITVPTDTKIVPAAAAHTVATVSSYVGARYSIQLSGGTGLTKDEVTLAYGNTPVVLDDSLTGTVTADGGTDFTMSATSAAPLVDIAITITLDEIASGEPINQLASATGSALVRNSPPIAATQTDVPAHDGTPTSIILGDAKDSDGQDVTYGASAPQHGTVTVSGTTATYSPASDYHGPDSFGFTADDGIDTSTGTISLVVNTAPAAQAQQLTARSLSPTVITLGPTTKADGTTISYTITQPAGHHGTLTGTGATLTYTPDTGYGGLDSFSFTAGDGFDTSAPATVSITVNVPPTATSKTVRAHQTGGTSIDLGPAVDSEAQGVSYHLTQQAAYGTVTGTGTARTYKPSAGFTGRDSFTFSAWDGVDVTTGVITVLVNVAPTATSKTVRVPQTGPTTIPLGPATDGDGQVVQYTIVAPGNGTLTGSGRTRTYNPKAGFTGDDSFSFTAADGTDTASGMVSLIVNVAPVAAGAHYVVPANSAVAVILGPDIDGDGQRVVYTRSKPVHGTVTGTGARRTYTPTAGYSGTDSFTFWAGDGTDVRTATISITVNSPPVAADRSVTTAYGTSATAAVAISDANAGQAHVCSIRTAAEHGTARFIRPSTPSVTYTPRPGFAGTDSFTYRVWDGYNYSAAKTVSVVVRRAASAITATMSRASYTSAERPTVLVTVASVGNETGGPVTVRGAWGNRTAYLSGGRATVPLPRLPGGRSTITLSFGGTSTAAPSAIRRLTLTVTRAATSLGFSTDPAQLTSRTTNARAMVRVVSALTATSGRVTISDANTGALLAAATARNGAAVMTLPRLALGQHNLLVSYTGTPYLAPAKLEVVERVPLR